MGGSGQPAGDSRATVRRTLRGALVGELLDAALDRLGPAPLRVVDAGGGTGGFAVPLAAAGHHVTVVDPSPDAMAALARRAAEGNVTGRIHAVQGDLAGLLDAVAAESADAVVCHNVLEVVDDPDTALSAVKAVLRPGGLASVLVANRTAAVLARAVAGRIREATTLLQRSAGPGCYDVASLHATLVAAGLRPYATHGIRIFSDLVPGALLDADPVATAALIDLERIASGLPDYYGVAAQLYVLATRSLAGSSG